MGPGALRGTGGITDHPVSGPGRQEPERLAEKWQRFSGSEARQNRDLGYFNVFGRT